MPLAGLNDPFLKIQIKHDCGFVSINFINKYQCVLVCAHTIYFRKHCYIFEMFCDKICAFNWRS